MTPSRVRAAVVGLAGPALSAGEVALLRARPPAGAILFARNVVDAPQVSALCAALRDLLGADAPILVDQEGGRVARLRAPHWPDHPAPAAFEGAPAAAVRANAELVAADCVAAGLDVVCAPLLDLRLPGAHGVIGDRAFSADPAEVARLGRAWCEGLLAAGATPVVKHVPGHGRATADSHLELPRVAATAAELAADLAPFAALAGLPAWAMTAHVLYEAWDATLPATLSPAVVEGVIRGAIGFGGVLVSDDLAMKALDDPPGALAAAALAAGCDLALHCTGVLPETAALLAGCPPLSDRAMARMADARAAARAAAAPRDRALLLAERARFLDGVALA